MTKKDESVLHTTEEPDTETEEPPFFNYDKGNAGDDDDESAAVWFLNTFHRPDKSGTIQACSSPSMRRAMTTVGTTIPISADTTTTTTTTAPDDDSNSTSSDTEDDLFPKDGEEEEEEEEEHHHHNQQQHQQQQQTEDCSNEFNDCEDDELDNITLLEYQNEEIILCEYSQSFPDDDDVDFEDSIMEEKGIMEEQEEEIIFFNAREVEEDGDGYDGEEDDSLLEGTVVDEHDDANNEYDEASLLLNYDKNPVGGPEELFLKAMIIVYASPRLGIKKEHKIVSWQQTNIINQIMYFVILSRTY